MGVGLGFGSLLEGTGMPFALESGPVLTGAALLLGLGLAGAAIATARIASVDPVDRAGREPMTTTASTPAPGPASASPTSP